MTITPQMTRRGKEIHRLSLRDLIEVIESGERLRAYCPVHGGDHQRSLSVDRATGWGFCHCCHATVLVEAMSSTLVFAGESQALRKRADTGQHPAATTPDWQRAEVAALQATLPLMREALATSWRAQRYLDERGIPLVSASTAGVGYLSRAVWEEISPLEAQHLLKRWIGRILFPLTSPFGQGFIGRTLLRWEPGMDENTHKALLSAGIPAESVLALVGTAARPSWLTHLAPRLHRVVLALDADGGGEEAMARLADEFQQARLAVSLCPPPADRWGKDWSERWRRLGPQSVFPLYEALARQQSAQKGVAI